MPELRRRIVEDIVASRLKTHGGVLITGPKAVGKTTTARGFAASEVRLDQDRAALAAARIDPRIVLDGEFPRLIDEYQLVDGLWDTVRGRIDDLARKGLFLLTGSATPDEDRVIHTGARRIAPVRMRTMSLLERDLSSGKVSLGQLFNGATVPTVAHRISVPEVMEAVGMGGWPTNLELSTDEALDANADYLEMIVQADVRRVDGVRRDPDGVRRLIASYARNVATGAALRTIGRTSEQPLSEPTLHDYLRALRRLYLIEDQDNWRPNLRSRVRLAATPKRHLADPSLAIAALGATPDRLLGAEIELAGFLFESQVIHDLRIYAEPHRASVRYYRDNKGLEVDAIVEARDGRWIGVEVKLGHHGIEEGAENLLTLRRKVADNVRAQCSALIVVSADCPTYTRPDGVVVTSVAVLGP